MFGITFSKEQLALAKERVKAEGLEDQVDLQLLDYRDLPQDGRFDKVVSVGMFEHVGLKNYDEYFSKTWDLLAPDGVMLTHTIGRLKLVTPTGEDPLVRGADGLFRPLSGDPLNADDAVQLQVGVLEGSNVNAIEAMVGMIQTARQFEAQTRLMQTAESNDRAAGQLLNLQLTFQNFLPITVEGLDLSLDYRLRGTPLGNFSASVNSAKTIRYYQAPNSIGDQLAEGQAKGEINAGVPITDMIEKKRCGAGRSGIITP